MNDMTTRDHIVDAADQLFYRQGYEHTSFSDIADAVQISRGNFYYHFKSKDEILDAVIDERLANTQTMLEQWEIEGKNARGSNTEFHQYSDREQSQNKTVRLPGWHAMHRTVETEPRSQPRRTTCSRCFVPGCAGNSRCWDARQMQTN